MKPFRFILPVARWIMRLSLVIYLFYLYINSALMLEFTQASFYVSALYVIGGILLFAGGFVRTHAITLVAALLLSGLAIYQLVVGCPGKINLEVANNGLLLAVYLYFLGSGNKS